MSTERVLMDCCCLGDHQLCLVLKPRFINGVPMKVISQKYILSEATRVALGKAIACGLRLDT